MATARAIVLSDLHMSESRAVFHESAALAAFLRDGVPAGPCELILAGDSFDFLLGSGYAGLSVAEAPQRLSAILAAHPDVVEALRAFASQPGHEITLLAGNHDPEVLLPGVREVFERALQRVGSLRYDEELVPGPGDRWPVHGRALPGGVWVVHGDRWDPDNAIDRAALLAGQVPVLPPGSALVYQILAPLQRAWPWIYEIKPELGAVLPLLLYLDPQRTLGYVKTHQGLTGRLLRSKIEGLLHSSTHLFGPREAPPPPASAEPGDALALLLTEALRERPELEQDTLLAGLEEWLRRGAPPEGTLASHWGVGRWLLRAWLRACGQGRGLTTLVLDGEDALPKDIAPYAEGRARAVIAGHTHGPRVKEGDGLRYLNTGTWIPVGELPRGPIEEVIDRLERREPWPSQTPRTFAQVEDGVCWLGACDAAGVPRSQP